MLTRRNTSTYLIYASLGITGCAKAAPWLAIAGVALTAYAATADHKGATVRVTSESPAAVTTEYTHTYQREYSAAVQKADSVCQRYGKHARPATSPIKLSDDRSVVTFDCVSP